MISRRDHESFPPACLAASRHVSPLVACPPQPSRAARHHLVRSSSPVPTQPRKKPQISPQKRQNPSALSHHQAAAGGPTPTHRFDFEKHFTNHESHTQPSMPPLARRLLHHALPRGARALHTPPTPTPTPTPGVLACRLASRAVVRFAGPEAARFLHSLLTNDLLHSAFSAAAASAPQRYAPARGPAAAYAALLTPQGRFLYDLFLYRPPPPSQMLDRTGSAPETGEAPQGDPQEVLADVDAAEVDDLVACFKR